MRFRVDRSAQEIRSCPPTIAGLQSQGVAGAWVTCRNPFELWAAGRGSDLAKKKPGHKGRALIDQFYGGGRNSTADDQYLATTGAGGAKLKW
jgi:hypothetical protein